MTYFYIFLKHMLAMIDCVTLFMMCEECYNNKISNPFDSLLSIGTDGLLN